MAVIALYIVRIYNIGMRGCHSGDAFNALIATGFPKQSGTKGQDGRAHQPFHSRRCLENVTGNKKILYRTDDIGSKGSASLRNTALNEAARSAVPTWTGKMRAYGIVSYVKIALELSLQESIA